MDNGRGSRVRTRGLRFWRPPLYQLSYTPITARSFHKDVANSSHFVKISRELLSVQTARRGPASLLRSFAGWGNLSLHGQICGAALGGAE